MPSVWPNMPVAQSRPIMLLFVFQLVLPTIEFGAAAWQVFKKAVNAGRPAVGMLLVTLLLQLPKLPTWFCRISIASWSESWFELKSPIFHSPKAIVLLVPSVMSLILTVPGSPTSTMAKSPGGLAR